LKGGAFEREVCCELSRWITQGERDDIFGRSDCSGGRFTQGTKGKAESQAGDMTFTHELGIPLINTWCVEDKTGYGKKKKIKKDGETVGNFQELWCILDCLDSKQSVPLFQNIWSQCKRDSILTSRKPVLIFRRNRRGKCIAIESCYFLELQHYFGDFKKTIISINISEERIAIMALKDFLEWIPGNFLEIMTPKTSPRSPKFIAGQKGVEQTIKT
jgi:hypothetical protein